MSRRLVAPALVAKSPHEIRPRPANDNDDRGSAAPLITAIACLTVAIFSILYFAAQLLRGWL